MDYLERFRGSEETARERVDRKVTAILQDVQKYVPSDYLERIRPINGVMDIELAWVEVPVPISSDSGQVFEIMPTIEVTDENTRSDWETPGVAYHVSLYGKLPNGDKSMIGRFGKNRSWDTLIIRDGNNQDRIVPFESPDAEIFLDLFQSALSAQDPESDSIRYLV